MSAEEIAKAFVGHYYHLFDTNRAALTSLYRNESMLTFEGQRFQGAQAIVEKLVNMPMRNVAHKVQFIDPQPAPGSGLIFMVTGALVVDGENDKPMFFTQTFNLQPIPGQNGFFVLNDIFRLNIH